MSSDNITLYAVGDMRPDWPNPESIVEMEFVLPMFKQADILFGNLASPLTDKGERQVGKSNRKISPEKLSVLTNAGFSIMSFANDCHLDQGDAAFFDTIERLDIALGGGFTEWELLSSERLQAATTTIPAPESRR